MVAYTGSPVQGSRAVRLKAFLLFLFLFSLHQGRTSKVVSRSVTWIGEP